MNYFEKHIGDYIRDTVSLTMLEDGAYNRLIDQVYQSEKPLPLDKKLIYRLARAISTTERKAVDFVVGTFFRETEDGFVQKRIQSEIDRYQEKQRKAKASADARWNRPRADANASQTHDASDMRTHCEGNAHQTPDTKHQTPDPKHKADDDSTDSGTASSFLPKRDSDLDPPRAAPLPMREHPPLSSDPAVVISVALRRLHVNANSMHPAVQDWANRGVSLELLTEAVSIARETKGDTAIPPNYLVPIVHGLLNPPALAEIKPGKPRDDWEWVKSDSGIQRKANELGIRAHGNMSFRDLADKCKAEIQRRKGTQK